jgi:hypothetical protein
MLNISATTSEGFGTTSGLSVLELSFDDLSLFQLESSSFFFNKKIFSAEVLGQERIPFLSVQQSALKNDDKYFLNILFHVFLYENTKPNGNSGSKCVK